MRVIHERLSLRREKQSGERVTKTHDRRMCDDKHKLTKKPQKELPIMPLQNIIKTLLIDVCVNKSIRKL